MRGAHEFSTQNTKTRARFVIAAAGVAQRRRSLRLLPSLTAALRTVLALCWHGLLSAGVEDVRDVLNGTDERVQELRTDAPFAGELPVAERNRLFRKFVSTASTQSWPYVHECA